MKLLKILGNRANLTGLAVLFSLGLLSPGIAAYRTANNSLFINKPENACYHKPFTYRVYRYGQWFEGVIYPILTLVPCSKYEPVAFFNSKYRVYKTTGDRSEACTGNVALKFNSYGRELHLTFVSRGSLPGNYCRDRHKVLKYRLYRR